MKVTILLRHRDLPIVKAQIDPTIPVVKVARALASEGLCLRHNPETQDLYLTYISVDSDWHIDIDDHGAMIATCPNCGEHDITNEPHGLKCQECGHEGVPTS